LTELKLITDPEGW